MDGKCFACGYEYESAWEIDKNKGDSEFIRINGTFSISGTDYYKTKHEIYLFACPKCGTVRLHPESL